MKKFPPVLVMFLGIAVVALAQRNGGIGGLGRRGGGFRGDYGSGVQTAREEPSGSTGTPEWTNPAGFEKDVFTFARIRYGSGNFGFGGYGRRGGGWHTDAPDSDLNLSYRLQQMTSLRVDPNGRYLDLTDPALMNFPWIYIVEPGALGFTDPEVQALRKYLLNGGFLWFDDFWGEAAWQNVEREMKRVLPDRGFAETALDHPIYHCVFNITSKGQIPGLGRWQAPGDSTSERGEESAVVHHRAIYDDKGRLMVLATHNTDNGDGWEREGENVDYFKLFSEKIAYPLGINVIFYVMTH